MLQNKLSNWIPHRLSAFAGIIIVGLSFISNSTFGTSFAFSNLASPGGLTADDRNFANISRWGQEFTAAASGQISEVKVNLYRTNAQTGAFNLELWSDSGGSNPTASLVVLKTLDWSDLAINNTETNQAEVVTVSSLDGTYTVASGTNYWLVLTQAANGPQAKRWTSTGSGLGDVASYNTNAGTWTNYGATSNLGAEISVVPEPAAYALIASAMILSCVCFRRRRS